MGWCSAGETYGSGSSIKSGGGDKGHHAPDRTRGVATGERREILPLQDGECVGQLEGLGMMEAR